MAAPQPRHQPEYTMPEGLDEIVRGPKTEYVVNMSITMPPLAANASWRTKRTHDVWKVHLPVPEWFKICPSKRAEPLPMRKSWPPRKRKRTNLDLQWQTYTLEQASAMRETNRKSTDDALYEEWAEELTQHHLVPQVLQRNGAVVVG